MSIWGLWRVLWGVLRVAFPFGKPGGVPLHERLFCVVLRAGGWLPGQQFGPKGFGVIFGQVGHELHFARAVRYPLHQVDKGGVKGKPVALHLPRKGVVIGDFASLPGNEYERAEVRRIARLKPDNVRHRALCPKPAAVCQFVIGH